MNKNRAKRIIKRKSQTNSGAYIQSNKPRKSSCHSRPELEVQAQIQFKLLWSLEIRLRLLHRNFYTRSKFTLKVDQSNRVLFQTLHVTRPQLTLRCHTSLRPVSREASHRLLRAVIAWTPKSRVSVSTSSIIRVVMLTLTASTSPKAKLRLARISSRYRSKRSRAAPNFRLKRALKLRVQRETISQPTGRRRLQEAQARARILSSRMVVRM